MNANSEQLVQKEVNELEIKQQVALIQSNQLLKKARKVIYIGLALTVVPIIGLFGIAMVLYGGGLPAIRAILQGNMKGGWIKHRSAISLN